MTCPPLLHLQTLRFLVRDAKGGEGASMLDLGGACELAFDSLCDTMHHIYFYALCDLLCLMDDRNDMCA